MLGQEHRNPMMDTDSSDDVRLAVALPCRTEAPLAETVACFVRRMTKARRRRTTRRGIMWTMTTIFEYVHDKDIVFYVLYSQMK